MKRLLLEDLRDLDAPGGAVSADVEAALDATPEIDRWCSGPDWVVPVHDGFAPNATTLLLSLESATAPGYALFGRYRLADGRRMIAGLEPLWGFACPLIGADVASTAEQAADVLAADPDWDVLVLPGMPTPHGPASFTVQVVRSLGWLGEVRVGEGITRQVADFADGHEAWLARRSARFRRNLRKAEAEARRAEVGFVDGSAEPEVFDRLFVIEGRTWKADDNGGITSPQMSATYRAMVGRLRSQGRLRVHLARRRDADIGYILGGVRAGRYRGLQLSYTADAAALSVGHLLQHHQIRRLCAEEPVGSYDLGMDLEYKRRWADRAETTFTIVIDRNGAGGAAR